MRSALGYIKFLPSLFITNVVKSKNLCHQLLAFFFCSKHIPFGNNLLKNLDKNILYNTKIKSIPVYQVVQLETNYQLRLSAFILVYFTFPILCKHRHALYV